MIVKCPKCGCATDYHPDDWKLFICAVCGERVKRDKYLAKNEKKEK